MLRSAEVTAFLATARPQKAKAFYQKTLKLRFVSEDDFAIVFETPNAMLRIQKVDKVSPHPFTALGWQVSNIARVVKQLAKHGVAFERYTFMDQDVDGIWIAPSGTRVAWFKDPDGHLLSLSQSPRA